MRARGLYDRTGSPGVDVAGDDKAGGDSPSEQVAWSPSARCGPLLRPFVRALERALGLTTIARLHRQLPCAKAGFCDAALQALEVDYVLRSGDLDRIPRTGPLVVVANHPFGGLDGLILLSLVARVRPDVKLLGNYLLTWMPGLRDRLIAVDPFRDRDRPADNRRAARLAARWLRSGGALAVFPAGEVAHAVLPGGSSLDGDWSSGAARLARRTGAAALPVFFHGSNSRIFRLAGRLHPYARTALLPRELLRKRGQRVAVSVGTPISASRLSRFEDAQAATACLRLRTCALAAAGGQEDRSERMASRPHAPAVASRGSRDVLEPEVGALEPPDVLLRSGAFDVCLARAAQVPQILLEIGRLRELSFRAVGEGSGKSRDVDEFDGHYLHLFVWNRERREIAGAYRIGPTDEVLPRLGLRGLYTSTLFAFDERLLQQIDPALELGRAFVAPDYQRDHGPLLLLWRGIAAYVHQNPRYRNLFGPVSISNSYQSVSRQILARFLYATSYRADLGRFVTPRHPPGFLRERGLLAPMAGPAARTLADVGALLAEIEADHRGVPVLVRQYLKLNARLLGFNVDPAFGGALDGLMLVDLAEVDRAILARYMGAARADEYLARHGRRGDARRAS